MSTQSRYNQREIGAQSPLFSASRTTIETAFLGNNVKKIKDLKEAYELAANSPGTIVTDMLVHDPEKIGLNSNSKVLLFNDGETTGRFADARKILGEKGVGEKEYTAVLREAIYGTRAKKLYHAQVFIGLNEDFMVKAHLLIPQGHENILYNWMLNFQHMSGEYQKMYDASVELKGEGDIFIFSDPDWNNSEHPHGLSYFDSEHNCAAVLGMRYFGEHKKGTLTLAWGIANRNQYVSCHGGLKSYSLENGNKYVMGVFGLSGSGKSTITHSKHESQYDIEILHDDAYIISTKDGSSVALEPSYFDKTQDYPLTEPANKFLITAQNCGACLDEEGKCVLVTEDIRNGNGRAIKSKLWADNRVDKFEAPINGIVWIMKDPALPPIVKIKDPILAAVMGATLATKRSSAEKTLKNMDKDALVIEPFANPFRTYPLKEDYDKFKYLFQQKGVDCFIINTGHFMDQKVPKELTLKIIEQIVNGTNPFISWNGFTDLEIMRIEDFMPDMTDSYYLEMLQKSMKERIQFLYLRKSLNDGRDVLPVESLDALVKVINEIEDYIQNHYMKAM